MSDTTSITSLPPAAQRALQRGNKIEAIRLTREATGLGLAEAKAFVEAHEHDAPGLPVPDSPPAPPSPVSGADGLAPGEVPASGGGARLWIGAVLLALAGYWAWRSFG